MEKGSDAVSLTDYVFRIGLKPESIIACHLDRARYDFKHHLEMAGMGVFLEYDTIGRPKYHSGDVEVELILSMVEYGFAVRLLFGLDTTNRRMKSYGGTIGLDYIKTVFVQKLFDAGLTEEIIRKFSEFNPQRALSIRETMAPEAYAW